MANEWGVNILGKHSEHRKRWPRYNQLKIGPGEFSVGALPVPGGQPRRYLAQLEEDRMRWRGSRFIDCARGASNGYQYQSSGGGASPGPSRMAIESEQRRAFEDYKRRPHPNLV
jgi:hypothetical protein